MGVRELFELKDKVALVTGGSRGLGLQIAQGLGEMGARIAISARKPAELEEAKSLLAKQGIDALTVVNDLTKAEQVPALVEAVVAHYGGLHILVNNAGITRDGLIHDMAPDAWLDVMRVNFGGAFHCTHAVADHFMAQGDGAIVNVSSAMAERGWIGQSNYCASKGALNAFTRAAAIELARFGVRVNAVLGGFTPTDMIGGILERDGGRGILRQIPMRRFADPEQIATVVAFLAGPDASYVTGEVVLADGGMASQLGVGRP
jgi:3-oxoacyl-[acyl-carrier protein] reductase